MQRALVDAQHVGASDHLLEGAEAHLRHVLAYLVRVGARVRVGVGVAVGARVTNPNPSPNPEPHRNPSPHLLRHHPEEVDHVLGLAGELGAQLGVLGLGLGLELGLGLGLGLGLPEP